MSPSGAGIAQALNKVLSQGQKDKQLLNKSSNPAKHKKPGPSILKKPTILPLDPSANIAANKHWYKPPEVLPKLVGGPFAIVPGRPLNCAMTPDNSPDNSDEEDEFEATCEV